MPLARSFGSVSAVSGVATLDLSNQDTRAGFQITVVPISASGTASFEYQPAGDNLTTLGYEDLLDADGAQKTVSLAAQATVFVSPATNNMSIDGIKVTSDNSADTFTVIGG